MDQTEQETPPQPTNEKSRRSVSGWVVAKYAAVTAVVVGGVLLGLEKIIGKKPFRDVLKETDKMEFGSDVFLAGVAGAGYGVFKEKTSILKEDNQKLRDERKALKHENAELQAKEAHYDGRVESIEVASDLKR